jgi:hypothetical protein
LGLLGIAGHGATHPVAGCGAVYGPIHHHDEKATPSAHALDSKSGFTHDYPSLAAGSFNSGKFKMC